MPGLVAHLDLDAFYASVELQRRPELRGHPVIVSGSGPRAVVTTCSYEARAFGVGSAMPTLRARRLCPHAVLVPPDFRAYHEMSARVMAIVRDHVETVEQLGMDEAYLDLSGLHSPKTAMRRLVADIREQTGMAASIGIGPNRVVAKVASDAEKPHGFVVLTREQAVARFADHPPGLVPGIGPKTQERLLTLGIRTLAQLAAADEELLTATFGPRQGPWLKARGAFHGSDVVTPFREAISESRETTFDEDVRDPAQMEELLRGLAVRLGEGLRVHERRGRTIAIKVRLDDFSTVTRARTIARPTDDPQEIADIAAQLLRDYGPQRPVRLLGVRAAGFAAEDDADATADEGQLALPM